MTLPTSLAIALVLFMGGNSVRPASALIGVLQTATATLKPMSPSLQAGGKAVLNIYTPFDAAVIVTLSGTLDNIIMSHVHWNTTGGPILLGLLPASNTTRAVPLNPPISLNGTLTWFSPISFTPALAATPGMDLKKFLNLLGDGRLYVNVHTAEFPAGALVGALRVTH